MLISMCYCISLSIYLPVCRSVAAKDLAASRRQTFKKQPKKQASIDSNTYAKKQVPVESNSNYVDPFESLEAGLKGDVSPSFARHWSISGSISGLKSKFSLKKTHSFAVPLRDSQDIATTARRRDRAKTASTFYDDENMSVTKNVSQPAEFNPLDLKGKNMNELLLLLKPVSLCNYVHVVDLYFSYHSQGSRNQ